MNIPDGEYKFIRSSRTEDDGIYLEYRVFSKNITHFDFKIATLGGNTLCHSAGFVRIFKGELTLHGESVSLNRELHPEDNDNVKNAMSVEKIDFPHPYCNTATTEGYLITCSREGELSCLN